MSPSTSADTTGAKAEHAALEELGTELTARGYHADVRTPPGRLSYLDVRNPRASVLAERVYVRADAFWFSWAEKIADSDDVTTAADTLARVLRTADSN